MGTNEQIMTWIKDTYYMIKGETDINAEGCCTGKYLIQGGIQGRKESTGLGVFYGVRQLMEIPSFQKACNLTPGLKDKTIVVQGFGNVGYYASKFFSQDGSKVVGIVEYNGAIYNPKGFDVEDVLKYFTEKKTLIGYPGATEENVKDPLSFMEKPCDFLIPAATEKSVHKRNADKLRCKVVVEGANGPTTFAAEEILTKKGVVLVPDMLINGGGVTVSYFEWLKNIDHINPGKMTKKYEEKQQMRLLKLMGHNPQMGEAQGAEEIDIVYSGLEEIMTTAAKETWSIAEKKNIIFRDACMVNAIQKVYKYYEQSGITI